ncbi:hypothetical protein ACHAAC_03700 [Aeromicrobium sp. CF4.19]|uniref:hypothetical protein n=1 Tax=Aeromicrobium sp. CF4.19 TaxID=3373082 RepID=UPI003EE753B6
MLKIRPRRHVIRLVNPLWYLATFLLALGGQVTGTAVAAGSWDAVRDADPVGTSEPIDAGGASLAVYTDVLQPDRDITCTATPPGEDAEPVDVPAAPLDLTATSEGTSWYLVGFLIEGRDELSVACQPADDAGDSASYAVAAAEGVQEQANVGNGVGWTGTLLGVVLAAFVFMSRRRNRQESSP